MTLAEISRRIENMIRIGTIFDVDLIARRVRVKSGGVDTGWLKWRSGRAGATREWNPPTIGEQVMILSPSGEISGGIVIPSIYSDEHDAPSSSPDMHVTDYPDGAQISYNHATGALLAVGIRTALVQASESVTAETPLVHCTGDVTIAGSLTVDGLLTYKSGMSGSDSGGAASASISGDVVIDGDVIINGVHVFGHSHQDPQGGNVGAMI